jgi:hypothetical protein
MRGYWGAIAAASALAFCGTLNAAQAQAPSPTPNFPNVPEVYKFDAGWPKPLPLRRRRASGRGRYTPSSSTAGTMSGWRVQPREIRC